MQKTLEERLDALERIVSISPSQNISRPPTTILQEYQDRLDRFSKLKQERILEDFLKHYEEMNDLLNHPQSFLTTEETKCIVLSCLNELEYYIDLLKQIKEELVILDQEFCISETKKLMLREIAENDPAEQVQDNYKEFVDLLAVTNDYYESISKLFTGYHHVLFDMEKILV